MTPKNSRDGRGEHRSELEISMTEFPKTRGFLFPLKLSLSTHPIFEFFAGFAAAGEV